ncbi:MAG: Ribonuclease 3 [Alphaproteobacteria bacterium MarineAlpha9_Bin4]|nr:ribonuclease III [Pelagibacterales bacterium]PPR25733.1 MAG: Ribonuclease 3 [Alphaproteobacteria bacterium MarineAlpha9_Bin4]|tara:strand:- start:1203 stop:1835 length:633 start_codon:yes stop_codon:yes gene_type:complete
MRIFDLIKEWKTISEFENIIWKKGKKEKEIFQRLEFLGDKVLALILSSVIFDKYKDISEGKLSKSVAHLCSGKTLSQISKDIKLEKFLKEKKNNIADKGLADSLEAIIGAFFINNGFKKTKNMVSKLWKDKINNIDKIKTDNKTSLQEWSQSKSLGLPKYSLISKIGPDHNPSFKVKVEVRKFDFKVGSGKTLREAEQNAAKNLLKIKNI